jgi:hypothetical protein
MIAAMTAATIQAVSWVVIFVPSDGGKPGSANRRTRQLGHSHRAKRRNLQRLEFLDDGADRLLRVAEQHGGLVEEEQRFSMPAYPDEIDLRVWE